MAKQGNCWRLVREIEKQDTWRGLAIKCLAAMRFEDYKFNSSQCNNLCYAFTSKLSKHLRCPAKGKRDFERSQIMQRAWREVYRVLKEVELYLQNCSGDLWWKKSATLATSGEAHAIHIHDLLWSVLCLDLNTLFVQNVFRGYDAVACRKFADFHAEMSNLTRIHDEYVDKKQLISALQREYEQRTDSNVEAKTKVEGAKFLATKLQAAGPIEPATIDTVPAWLNVDPDHLVISKHDSLGEGSYGLVYRGSWLGLDVAVKELPRGAYELFRTEALVLAKLHCPFIVQLIGTCVKEESCYVVMELVHSSLFSEIEKRSEQKICPPFPLHVAVDIMLQISRGMEYLHDQGIMHVDLKAANVLIEPSVVPEFREEGYCRVKLCDFGMAGLKLYSFRRSFPKGTTCWRAPEAFAYPQEHIQMDNEVPKEYTYKADVYSFAMTCYEILTGKLPFEDVPNRDVYRKIIQGERPNLPSSHIPPLLGDYIRRCWDTDPCRRPCFKDVSMFLRYVKLLIMRMDDLSCVSPSRICSNFQEQEIGKCFEGNSAFVDERVTNEEEAHIIRALEEGYRRNPLQWQNAQALGPAQKGHLSRIPDYIRKYSSEELWDATGGFSRKISGVSFVMSEGVLRDGSHVVVKQNTTDNFLNEVIVVSRLHHPNILRLRGSDSNFYLVFDAAAMGSLDKWLFGVGNSHDWNMRRGIGLGIARSIAYLHGDCENRILNVALDSKSILLDERFTPKLCGFESAVPVDYNSSPGNLQNRSEGLEYGNVYSFGIILLEILSGCRWEDMQKDMGKVYDDISSKSIVNFLDKQLQGAVEELECRRLVHVALWCMVSNPSRRPNMIEVVSAMEGLSEFPTPPPIDNVNSVMDEIWKFPTPPRDRGNKQLMRIGSERCKCNYKFNSDVVGTQLQGAVKGLEWRRPNMVMDERRCWRLYSAKVDASVFSALWRNEVLNQAPVPVLPAGGQVQVWDDLPVAVLPAAGKIEVRDYPPSPVLRDVESGG